MLLRQTMIFPLLWVALATTAAAQQTAPPTTLSLAAPISDHMVLQQGKSTSLWGIAAAGSTITAEFAGQKVIAKAGENGRWELQLQPLTASDQASALTVTSDSGEKIVVSDVLVGEVWMCSGQSNMFFTLSRIGDPPLKESNLPKIRFFNTVSATARVPQQDCQGQWEVMSSENAGNCSAVAYFFGRHLHQELGVPIGLVNTAWGGKPVEAFTSYEKLQSVSDAKPLLAEWSEINARYQPEIAKTRYESALAAWNDRVAKIKENAKSQGTRPQLPRKPTLQGVPVLDPGYPAAIYNQKVAPWTNYAIAGAIWYQGESNRGRAVQYRSLLTALIEDWRSQWHDDFPFYIVQLANFQTPSTEPGTPDSWAELQAAQSEVARSVPNCGIAITNDIGEAADIHPKNKRDVGYRLALLALKQTYGQAIAPHASPSYRGHDVAGNRIVVAFDHVGEGLKTRDGGELQRFEIAGEDRTWHWAKASIADSGDQVILSSEDVANPVAARYAWASNPAGANLVGSSGLPASLFRTDDWPMSTEGVLTRLTKNDQAMLAATKQRMIDLGYTPLFNGTDLSGWRNPYDHGEAQVVDGEIHLTGDKKFFLVTDKKYSDFRLIGEIKLPAGSANSGIMFRCHVEPNKVYGYQAECDGSDRRWSAGLFDEGRRKWVWPSTKGRSLDEFLKYEQESKAHFAKPEIRDALKRDDWNRYIIHCRGDRISIELNGVQVTNLRDGTDAEGYIGIQHHGEKGQTYRFRNLFIKELAE